MPLWHAPRERCMRYRLPLPKRNSVPRRTSKRFAAASLAPLCLGAIACLLTLADTSAPKAAAEAAVGTTTTTTATPTSPPHYHVAADAHIVRLRGYAHGAVLEAVVRAMLAPFLPERALWRFVSRDNLAAANWPTDFVLLETGAPAAIRRALLRNTHVIHAIAPQEEHTRHALGTENHPHDPIDASKTEPLKSRLHSPPGQRHLSAPLPTQHAFGAGTLWVRGFRGGGMRVAVFDTGLDDGNPHFPNVVERTDWTEERNTGDSIGHGTFVAGLIGGHHPHCHGIAPDAEIITFRVFTGAQVSYTSWFLDAFNYAMHLGVDILNLSIGGPDFTDQPFVDKVNELTARGIIIVSAIGNDGPLWGSLNNPADMMEVVGVGGVEPDGSIAQFSSRGMTTHEIGSGRAGYGRVKPDLVAYGRTLSGPSHQNVHSCRRLSGTSVASPIVAGAIALIASTVPAHRRKAVVNPASVKRALIVSSRRLEGSSMYEQGSGLLDIAAASEEMQRIDAEFVASMASMGEPSATFSAHLFSASTVLPAVQSVSKNGNKSSQNVRPDAKVLNVSAQMTSVLMPGPSAILLPRYLDLSSRGCPYMWPHCAQPMFYGMQPICVNVTILNPGGVKGVVDSARWIPGRNGHLLRIRVTKPPRFWPWAGGLGVHLSVEGPQNQSSIAEGIVQLRIRSVIEKTYSVVELPVRVDVAPTPLREKRLLWDIFHSVRYPPSYVPRDNLAETKDMLDWLGDHPHTNYQAFFRRLRLEGYFIDVWDVPLTCLPDESGDVYGALLLFDTEDYFTTDEVTHLQRLVTQSGMAVVVASEWHNEDVMQSVRFEDDNTRSWWDPVVGGGNVPALNELLRPYGIALGDVVFSGFVRYKLTRFPFASGNGLVRFPIRGEVIYGTGMAAHDESNIHSSAGSIAKQQPLHVPILGIARAERGCIAVYGDTNCIDTAHGGRRCHDMFTDLIGNVISCRDNVERERLLTDSVILMQELVPTKLATGRVASSGSENTHNLFRPHSRTIHPSGAPGSPRFRDLKGYCETHVERLEGLEGVLDDPRLGTSVRFPTVQHAKPVGSAGGYYETIGPSLGAIWSYSDLLGGSWLFPNEQPDSILLANSSAERVSVALAETKQSDLMSHVVWLSTVCGALLVGLSISARIAIESRRIFLFRRQRKHRFGENAKRPLLGTGGPNMLHVLSSTSSSLLSVRIPTKAPPDR